MIKAEIIADSLNKKNGSRLTTFILEFPRWILAEVGTHRMLSKNVASSRAIPIEKMIEMVLTKPAMPEFWGKNQSGMQSNEELSGSELDLAKKTWLEARDSAVKMARKLAEIGMHKQYVNRLIENFMYVRAIVSGTDWQNMFALRAHGDAQPEFRVLAYKMLDVYNNSTSKVLGLDEWHIPFGENMDIEKIKPLAHDLRDQFSYRVGKNQSFTAMDVAIQEIKLKIAIARCARVSYYNFEGKDNYEADVKLCDKLFGSIPRHLSPTEHVAMAVEENIYLGNFKGFKQFRKFYQDENLKDGRVIKK